MTKRRLSWKAAHRKNRPSSDTRPTAFHIQQEINPYKPFSSLRGSQQQNNNNASIQEGNYERNASRPRRLSDSLRDYTASVDEDDDLDLILSGIELDDRSTKSPQQVSSENVVPPIDIEVNDLQVTKRDRGRSNNLNGRVRAIRNNVDFGDSSAGADRVANINERKNALTDSSHELSTGETSTGQDVLQSGLVVDEDNKTWLSPDLQLGNHTRPKSISIQHEEHGVTIPPTDEPLEQSTKSFVDEIMQDSPIISSSLLSSDDTFKSKPIHEMITCPSSIPQCKETPLYDRQDDNDMLDPIESISTARHEKNIDTKSNNRLIDFHKKKKTSNIFGVIHHDHNQADDTISTVTDHTDSPYIFTYKRPNNDDDSVSQITSSVAPSLVSLKNIPENERRGLHAITEATANRFQSKPWMSRTTKRGVVTPGTFGRDKNRKNAGLLPSSGRSIGSNGTAESPYQESNSNLDEIAYAINGSGRQHPQKKHFNPRNRSQEFDLCTIDSEKSGVSRRRSAQDSQSYTSIMGNSAVSCAGYSLTNGSASKASSSRSEGLLHGFALLARRAERFFLPTSPKVCSSNYA